MQTVTISKTLGCEALTRSRLTFIALAQVNIRARQHPAIPAIHDMEVDLRETDDIYGPGAAGGRSS